MEVDLACLVCYGTDETIKPKCCKEKHSICFECIEQVDMCPFCRSMKQCDYAVVFFLYDEVQDRFMLVNSERTEWEDVIHEFQKLLSGILFF